MDDTKVADEASLYQRDFFQWTRAQAAALRSVARGGKVPLDYENLAEEIESLGNRDQRELASRIATIIEHLLKLELSRAQEPRADWIATILRERDEIEAVLTQSPSLRAATATLVARGLTRAARPVAVELEGRGEIDPKQSRELRALASRYSVDQVLGDWLPKCAASRDEA